MDQLRLLRILFFFVAFIISFNNLKAKEIELSLDVAINIAKSNNLELKYLEKELESKDFLKTQYAAAYLPQVDMTLIYPFVGRSSQISFRQILYDFGKLNKRVEAGGYAIKAFQYTIASKKDEIVNRISENFYEILKIKNSIKKTKKDIATNKKLLEKNIAFMNAGRSSTIDVTDANIDLSESELEFIELQGELLKFEEDLFNLIGIEKPKIVNYESSLKYTRLNLNEDQVLEVRSFHDAEVKSIEMGILSQKALISAYKRDFLPTLVAGGAYRFEGKGVADEDKDNDFIVGLGLTWEIFAGGKTMGQIREAKARIEALNAKLAFAKSQMKSTIKYGLIDLDTAYYKIDVYKKSLSAAQLNYNFVKTKFESGESSSVDLEEAEQLLEEQNSNYENAIYSYLIKIARFEKVVGVKVDEKN